MKITICGSMVFSEKMLEVKRELEKLGHEAFAPVTTNFYQGKTIEQKVKLAIQNKTENDAMIKHYNLIKRNDAILVLNYERKGIVGYIGGNTFLEIGFAYVLNKSIFLMNSVPEIDLYKSEIEATKPVIINNDLSKLFIVDNVKIENLKVV